MTRIMFVARWQGGAAGRFQEAALRLYVERGYEQTTVAEIASEAGLTARTFFRYFADKREVLFAGSEALQGAVRAAAEEAPADAPPMQVVAATLDAVGALIGRDREYSRLVKAVVDAPAGAGPMTAVAAALDVAATILGRDHRHSSRRQSVIMANAELRERELIKMATIAALLAEELRSRGVPPQDASLAAESGAVVLRVAFEQWVAGPPDGDLRKILRDTLSRLTAVVG